MFDDDNTKEFIAMEKKIKDIEAGIEQSKKENDVNEDEEKIQK